MTNQKYQSKVIEKDEVKQYLEKFKGYTNVHEMQKKLLSKPKKVNKKT
jgi:NADPH-dependent 7-cyano-7-deazaguanine reductase QueF